jgi:hypothetical protein
LESDRDPRVRGVRRGRAGAKVVPGVASSCEENWVVTRVENGLRDEGEAWKVSD